MGRRVAAVPLVLCLCICPIVGGERSIESLVPADAYLSVFYDGTHPQLQATAIARFLREPEVADALKLHEPVHRLFLSGASRELGLDAWPLLRAAAGCQIAVAFGPRSVETGEPQVLFIARVGAAGSLARTEASGLRESLLTRARPGTAQGVRLGVSTLTAFRSKDGRGQLVGFIGPFFILGDDGPFLRRALAPATPRLKMPRDAERAVLRVHYDHVALLKSYGAELAREPEAMRGLDALGINAIRTVDLAFVPRGKRLVTRFEVALLEGAARVGLPKWLADSPPADREMLKMVPRDAVSFTLTSMDLPGLWEEFWATLGRISPRAAARARRGLARFEAGLGAPIGDSLLRPLARGTLAILHGGPWPGCGVTIVQRTRDPDTLEAGIRRLVAGLNGVLAPAGRQRTRARLKSFRYRGHQAHYVWLGGPAALYVPGLAPCYTRLGKVFVVSTHPLHLKSYLDFVVDQEPSILDDAAFRRLQDAVPTQACLISYGTWPETVSALYNTLAPLLMATQGLEGAPAGLDLANLPSSRLVRRYARGAVLYAVFEEGRYRAELQGDGLDLLSPQVGPVFVGAFLAGLTYPAVVRARAQAQTTTSLSNTRQLVMAAMLYANDHQQTFPPNLAVAFPYYDAPDLLIAPLDPAPPRRPGRRPCSYVYFLDARPGLKVRWQQIDNAAQTMVLWERDSFRGDGRRCVAFADGHCEIVDEQRFRRLKARLDAFLRRLADQRRRGHL